MHCRELIHEEKAGSIEYRSTFGTQRVGGFIANAFDLYLKNPANTNVVEWGKRLLALWEVRSPCSVFGWPSLLALRWAALSVHMRADVLFRLAEIYHARQHGSQAQAADQRLCQDGCPLK